MLITAINYQNNMSFALTFLLATLFVVGVLHTYANLSGLTILVDAANGPGAPHAPRVLEALGATPKDSAARRMRQGT